MSDTLPASENEREIFPLPLYSSPSREVDELLDEPPANASELAP